jgi:hypothetical protein
VQSGGDAAESEGRHQLVLLPASAPTADAQDRQGTLASPAHSDNTPPAARADLVRAQKYWDLRDEVVAAEQILLRTLDFDLTFIHPHKFLLNYINSLNGTHRLLLLLRNLLKAHY